MTRKLTMILCLVPALLFPRCRGRFLRQYFKFVRPGAVRIEAATTDERLDPVAFINADGSYVVVVKADSPGTLTIGGLPAGTYGGAPRPRRTVPASRRP